ncbi:unnamed protein product [Aureobasidium pullulans]|nr:unnamed protein product [Aureobasidium pullulans]
MTELNASTNSDYDLSSSINDGQGLRQGLTSYGDARFSLFLRKVFIKAAGYSDDALSRQVIGIINTHSGFNPCHAQVPQLIEAVKRGVMLSGGLPIDFPTISLHESFSTPTSMFLRNLMSMDTEEMIRAQPLDACVMIGGCDKTVPAQLMGGISSNKPVLPLVAGPMMPGSNKGVRIGACTDCRSNWAAFRAGAVDIEDISSVNEELAPTIGRTTPLLVDLKPSGANYMTDFHNAGGMAALLTALRPLLHLDAKTVTGKTLGEELDSACFTPFPYTYEIIRPLEQPLYPHSALAVVMGNLAPNGAILKAAASKDRQRSVLVLKGVGPIGNPGMPEAGVIPIPRKLAAQGVQDMLRISDGRMSGTAGGTIILHVSPESAVAEDEKPQSSSLG